VDIKVERKYELFFMLPDGEERIYLTRDMFPKNHDVGFSRGSLSVYFQFKDKVLETVTVSSNASLVKTKTLRQVEAEDELEVKNYLRIRCLKDLRGLIPFLTPVTKKKVKKLKRSDISVKSNVWQWDFAEYCKRIVRNAMPELNPIDARGLMSFLRGKRHE